METTRNNKKHKAPVQHGVADVPVVMQMEALECGAACLTMILAYYGRWIPLEQARVECGVSRDGVNAKNIMEAARRYGLEGAGFKVEPETLREEGSFPCIVHWNFEHFVVCRGFKGKYVYLNDPARGDVRVTAEEFDECFTGVILQFEPGPDFQEGGKRKSTVEFAAGRLKGARTAVIFVIMTLLISNLFGIISPGMTRFFMDRLLTGENGELLMPFILLFAGLGALQVIVSAISAIYSLRISGKMTVVGSSSYMWKVLKLPMEFFSQRMAGDIQMRKDTNATISQTVVDTLTPLAINSIMIIFYLVVMLRYSPVLTLVGIVSVVLNAFLGRYISDKRVNITRVQMRDAGKLSSYTVNGIQMVETIKASGAESGFFEKWAGYQASVNAQTVRYSKLDVYLGMLPAFVTLFANSAVLIIGVLIAMQGHFSIGMIMAFQSFMSSFMGPAMTTISAGQTIQEMRTDMERVEDVMQYPDDVCFNAKPAADGDDAYHKLRGEVELKNVSFGYSPLKPPLITDFSMKVKPGSSVAFVGPSGCGKSTLAKLISGLYQPWEGQVLFDGKPASEIDRNVFTGSVAVVDQDIILFEDSIADNIKMWDQSIEQFEVIMAARDAQIHDDILQRPGGYNARITEGGRDLSGGQKQRLEIARVLAQDPSVIIMDEATSALDAKTEFELVKAVKERGITCIVIAHRLSTIRDCDEIIVLDHGKVVERGTHSELYEKGGLYRDLVVSN